MTDLAPRVGAFLREHLPQERRLSRKTIASYASSLQLLIAFASARSGIRPCLLAIEHLTAQIILDFLDSLERERGNTARTRNLRLAAIKTFFRYLEFCVPEHLDRAQQVQAIPYKRFDRALVDYLERDELQAVLDAPNTRTRNGTRDRAMLHMTYAAGLRVSELIGLRCKDLSANTDMVHVMGKGRRERTLPLWKETQTVLHEWLAARPNAPTDHLFLNSRGAPMSRHGFAHRLALHVETARLKIPSLKEKRVSPHVLRHSCAMHTLEATRDIRKVSLWLGHSSLQATEIYLHAHPDDKIEMLAEMTAPQISKGKFGKAADELMTMLAELKRA